MGIMPTNIPALSSLLLLFSCANGLSSSLRTVDVILQTGIFRGVATANGTDTFFGIPFAKPPVGDLHFKAPVPITESSSIVKDASKFGNACPQLPASGLGSPIGESCLFLNVGGPNSKRHNRSDKYIGLETDRH